MAKTFKTPSANKMFGQFKEPNEAGQYILNKKAKTVFCGGNQCTPSTTVNTQGNLLLLKKSNLLKYYNKTSNFNKANLNINLLTKLNLENIDVWNQNNTNSPYIFVNYTIDPSGTLFGNTACGLYNYVSYMVYNPRNSFPIPDPDYIPTSSSNNYSNIYSSAELDLLSNGGSFIIQSVPTILDQDNYPQITLPTNVKNQNSVTIYNICGETISVYSPTITMFNYQFAPYNPTPSTNNPSGTNSFIISNDMTATFTYIYDAAQNCTIIVQCL